MLWMKLMIRGRTGQSNITYDEFREKGDLERRINVKKDGCLSVRKEKDSL